MKRKEHNELLEKGLQSLDPKDAPNLTYSKKPITRRKKLYAYA